MSGLRITLSDRLSDIDRVIAVVHDGFVDAGFLNPQRSGRRVIPHYLTPGAAFILGEVGGEAVGACTVVPDGPWGIPSEHAFPEAVARLRAGGPPLAEVGSLAVSPRHRAMSRHLVMHLTAAATRVVTEMDHTVVITIAPAQERFYRGTFGFVRVAGPHDLYGAPAILVVTTSEGLRDHLACGTAMARRTMAALVSDPAPDWLVDRRVDVRSSLARG